MPVKNWFNYVMLTVEPTTAFAAKSKPKLCFGFMTNAKRVSVATEKLVVFVYLLLMENKVSREEKLKKITELTNSSLLELYADYVRYHHYNYKSIKEFDEFYNLSITTEDLEGIILERMT